jgi:hypothetical protein
MPGWEHWKKEKTSWYTCRTWNNVVTRSKLNTKKIVRLFVALCFGTSAGPKKHPSSPLKVNMGNSTSQPTNKTGRRVVQEVSTYITWRSRHSSDSLCAVNGAFLLRKQCLIVKTSTATISMILLFYFCALCVNLLETRKGCKNGCFIT